MDTPAKHKKLSKISEANLREILMNLLDRMGLEPVLTHGILEYGKDIVSRQTSTLGITEWSGFVVKVGKITGSTSGSGSLQTVLNQIQEAFIHPYIDSKGRKNAINKVFVVNNDQILTTAREKIADKLSSVQTGAAANVSFIDGAALTQLLDEHWPDFWKTRTEVFDSSDPMSSAVGKTLYVVALAYTLHERRMKKKPAYLSKDAIMKQTGFDEETVDATLGYLIQRQYLAQSDTESYTLDPKFTVGRLLTKTSHIRLLRLLDKNANHTRHISGKRAKEVARKAPLNFTSGFVKQALALFLRGGYLDRDDSRGKKNHYTVTDGMLQDEKEYLDCWLAYNGAVPQQASK